MKNVLVVLVGVLLSVSAYSADKINSKESLRICKSALNEDAGDEVQLKIKRKTATSVESSKFKHWFNVVEMRDGEKASKKLRCETTRTGELLVIYSEPGKWRI